jgi:predicted site-specific integrase-resolvase
MLTYSEIAQEANVSTRTVKRWVRDFIRLPVVRFSHKCVRVRESDWEEFKTRKLIKRAK